MSWLDKEISFNFMKKKKDDVKFEVKTKKVKKELTDDEKKKIKIKIPFMFLEYSLLIYFTLLVFAPEFILPLTAFLTPFMGVVKVLYAIIGTGLTLVMIPVGIVLIIVTYTTKLDDQHKEPDLPDFTTFPKFVLYTLKDCFLVYLSWTLGFYYIAILVCTQILFTLLYKFIERDFTAKMVKLRLAWEDPRDKPFSF